MGALRSRCRLHIAEVKALAGASGSSGRAERLLYRPALTKSLLYVSSPRGLGSFENWVRFGKTSEPSPLTLSILAFSMLSDA
jgi:hypothetical protein